MRTFRHARLFAAAGITVATLALTACQNGTGTKDEGASKPTPSTTATASPTDDTKGSQPTQHSNSGSGKTSQPAQQNQTGHSNRTTEKTDKTDQAGKSSSNPAICNGSNTKVTAQPVSRPLNHMLLTVTNTGSKPCSLMYYPVLRFDEMQWVPQGRPDSKPQAVPTLSPGASGYAGVLLSAADGSGDGGTTGKKLTIAFQGGTPNSSGGASATPALPAKGVYYDSSLSVTYWQSEMADALN
ncbi:DUF4232 domain-containing protein [Streptomyces sp. DG2A-72]|uniref:DUF4232 domain-containing protein n=1 Tax=Streptomyces sp. DG2A-72 TaxID=3051386 RepID=UPI00265C34AE|nr:DUF4232 domain-containing protein [Streptomyces sp. DG2A-72]MDO0935382.1 DUF4232 domain-containing protein [Streptomyces sp. DG2A-72]